MDNIKRNRSWREFLVPEEIPDVDDVRPKRCSRCKALARGGRRVVIHGHGRRTRQVVVAPALSEEESAQVIECWERRYKCTDCQAILVVLPKGVMPRYLYSVAAIVMAFFLVAERPVGEGMSQALAYDRQGMFRNVPPKAFSDPSYRWRSVGRWACCAEDWWEGWSGPDVSGLLLLFLERSGTCERTGAIPAAINSHALWGCAM